MEHKKKYIKPQIFKVCLDPSQAILAVCKSGATGIRATNPNNWNVCQRKCKHKKRRRGGCNDTANS